MKKNTLITPTVSKLYGATGDKNFSDLLGAERESLLAGDSALITYWIKRLPCLTTLYTQGCHPTEITEIYNDLQHTMFRQEVHGKAILKVFLELITTLADGNNRIISTITRLFDAPNYKFPIFGNSQYWWVNPSKYDSIGRSLHITDQDLNALSGFFRRLLKNGATSVPEYIGRLSIQSRGKTTILRYPDKEGQQLSYKICGKARLKDLEVLITANGQFVKMPKGFPQRWGKSDSQLFKNAAIESNAKQGGRGGGMYRLIK